MRKIILLPLFFLCFAACTSPYDLEGNYDVPVQARMLGPDLVELTPLPEITSECMRRDALFFKAAAVTMENQFTHFEFVGTEPVPYSAVGASPNKSMTVHLCQGTCLGYSASAIANVLLRKFQPPRLPELFAEKPPVSSECRQSEPAFTTEKGRKSKGNTNAGKAIGLPTVDQIYDLPPEK